MSRINFGPLTQEQSAAVLAEVLDDARDAMTDEDYAKAIVVALEQSDDSVRAAVYDALHEEFGE